ncbi:MAG: septum formation initiator family protein [Candidatus Staskawiczbacteria bacterium]|nr:septum formation initiator family protein [Candidatus Staskawiczbacteria bacterium]
MVAEFRKKRKEKFVFSQIWLPVLGVFLVLLMIVFIFVDFHIYNRRKELVAQIDSYQKQIDEIKNSNQDLKDEIENADNIDYLEKIAYEQLGEQKPGETGVIFISPQPKQAEVIIQENVWTSWFSQAWNWIKSKF